MRRVLPGLCVLVTLAAPACGRGAGSGAGDGRLLVVASFYPVAEAAQRVGGGDVRVTNLTPPGVEPHDLELTPRQVDEIEDADVVLYLGGGFQPAVEQAVRRARVAVDLLAALPLRRAAGERNGGREGADPHFWLDPTLLARAVDRIEAALAAARPGAAARFRRGAETYREELRALDAEFEAGLARCQRRDIVTSHAAFGYLAERYRLEQVAVTGVSPEAEPDPRRLAELADLVRARGVTTVFSETLVSPEVARTLAREAGVRTATLDPLEGLSQDDVRMGASYASVMRRNLGTLREALSCA